MWVVALWAYMDGRGGNISKLHQFIFILTSTRQPTPVVLSTDTAQFSRAVLAHTTNTETQVRKRGFNALKRDTVQTRSSPSNAMIDARVQVPVGVSVQYESVPYTAYTVIDADDQYEKRGNSARVVAATFIVGCLAGIGATIGVVFSSPELTNLLFALPSPPALPPSPSSPPSPPFPPPLPPPPPLLPLSPPPPRAIQGAIKLMQPLPIQGNYEIRTFEEDACKMISASGGNSSIVTGSARTTDGTVQERGCYSVDNFWAPKGPKPFMWGSSCFLGNVVLPEGILMTVHETHGSFDDLCQKGLIMATLTGPKNESQSNVMFHSDGARRACGFKLVALPGFACS